MNERTDEARPVQARRFTARAREDDLADVSELRRRRTDPLARYWSLILWGITTMLLLALGLVVIARLETVGSKLTAAKESAELARTRYETLIREIHEVKVKIDYQGAVYENDVRNGLTKQKERR